MTNINRDPLLRAIFDAAQAVEACGASEALTAAVMAVTAIYRKSQRRRHGVRWTAGLAG